jgi:hypothetical protein
VASRIFKYYFGELHAGRGLKFSSLSHIRSIGEEVP